MWFKPSTTSKMQKSALQWIFDLYVILNRYPQISWTSKVKLKFYTCLFEPPYEEKKKTGPLCIQQITQNPTTILNPLCPRLLGYKISMRWIGHGVSFQQSLQFWKIRSSMTLTMIELWSMLWRMSACIFAVVENWRSRLLKKDGL